MYVMSKARLIFSQVLEAVPLVAILLGWWLVSWEGIMNNGCPSPGD